MLERMIRAMKLDAEFYEMVEADSRYMREALIIVTIAAICGAIGTMIAYRGTAMELITGLFATLFSWVAWAGITLFIGTTITKGPETKSDMGEMLRVLGYAHTPQILFILLFIPLVGTLIAAVASVWSLIAGIVAIRQALDFTTMRAIITVVIGWVVVLVLRGLVAWIF